MVLIHQCMPRRWAEGRRIHQALLLHHCRLRMLAIRHPRVGRLHGCSVPCDSTDWWGLQRICPDAPRVLRDQVLTKALP